MTVGLVIVSHSAKLAEGVVEVANQMAHNKTPMAAAGGGPDEDLGTSAEKIFEAIQQVDGPDGVLVLLDLGSALLSTETALELLSDEQRNRVRLSIAPLVEGAVTAALEASFGRTLAEVQQAAEKMASVDQLRKLKPVAGTDLGIAESVGAPLEAATTPEASTGEQTTREIHLTLTNPSGLHARPASLFVQTAARFKQAQVRAIAHGRDVNAASIVSVLSLGLRQGETVTLRANGDDAEAALAALSDLVRANFYE